jgi:hypothetical protein
MPYLAGPIGMASVKSERLNPIVGSEVVPPNTGSVAAIDRGTRHLEGAYLSTPLFARGVRHVLRSPELRHFRFRWRRHSNGALKISPRPLRLLTVPPLVPHGQSDFPARGTPLE